MIKYIFFLVIPYIKLVSLITALHKLHYLLTILNTRIINSSRITAIKPHCIGIYSHSRAQCKIYTSHKANTRNWRTCAIILQILPRLQHTTTASSVSLNYIGIKISRLHPPTCARTHAYMYALQYNGPLFLSLPVARCRNTRRKVTSVDFEKCRTRLSKCVKQQQHCGTDVDPVCGSDANSYPNQCHLNVAICL